MSCPPSGYGGSGQDSLLSVSSRRSLGYTTIEISALLYFLLGTASGLPCPLFPIGALGTFSFIFCFFQGLSFVSRTGCNGGAQSYVASSRYSSVVSRGVLCSRLLSSASNGVLYVFRTVSIHSRCSLVLPTFQLFCYRVGGFVRELLTTSFFHGRLGFSVIVRVCSQFRLRRYPRGYYHFKGASASLRVVRVVRHGVVTGIGLILFYPLYSLVGHLTFFFWLGDVMRGRTLSRTNTGYVSRSGLYFQVVLHRFFHHSSRAVTYSTWSKERSGVGCVFSFLRGQFGRLTYFLQVSLEDRQRVTFSWFLRRLFHYRS